MNNGRVPSEQQLIKTVNRVVNTRGSSVVWI